MRSLPGGILDAVGNTPLVRLTRVIEGAPFALYAKLEAANPGGSIKDRTAVGMIRDGIEKGLIGPDTVIIESSSGNLAVGLAQACRYFGLRFICVVDPLISRTNLSILKAYGAAIEMVNSGSNLLQARLDRVEHLLAAVPRSHCLNQYRNPANPLVHRDTTMAEIVSGLNGKVDFIFAAGSTCGTLMGCAQFLKANDLSDTKIIAVDAVGSVIFGGQTSRRLIPGHGSSVVPPLLDRSVISEVIKVSDLDCVAGCRRLVQSEAILAGGSSGGVIASIQYAAPRIPAGANCVAILADRGERYLDTIYSDTWVREHFGESSLTFEAMPPFTSKQAAAYAVGQSGGVG